MVLCEGRSKWHPKMRMVDVYSCARGATTPNLQCRALPGNRRTLACDESGVMARLGASGDQWAVPRAQSRSTEPYWEPVELEEEGVARGGVVVVVLVSREIAFSKHQLGPQTCISLILLAHLVKTMFSKTSGRKQAKSRPNPSNGPHWQPRPKSQRCQRITCELPPNHRWTPRWPSGPRPFALSPP